MRVLADKLARDPSAMTCVDGKWVIARPINYQFDSIIERIRDAWLVLTGKAEALIYYKQ